MDIFPTIAEIVGLPDEAKLEPQDGTSLKPLFEKEIAKRANPIGFSFLGQSALIDNDYKIDQGGGKRRKAAQGAVELFNIADDPSESKDLSKTNAEVAETMKKQLDQWLRSVQASVDGADYPEKKVNPGHPTPKFWTEVEAYRPYFPSWKERPEYRSRLKK